MKEMLLTVLLGAFVLPVSGADRTQEKESDHHEPHSLVFARADETMRRILCADRPDEARAVPVPNFVIHTRDRKFILSIGGYINPILGYDIGNNLYQVDGAGINFTTSLIPVPPREGHKADYFINPLHGALDLQVTGLGGTDNQITGYIQIQTYGNNVGLRLKRAYISWRGITAGQKQTLFQDGEACQPPTIDPQGPAGMISQTVYEISYKSRSYSGFRFAAGVSMPSFYASTGIYKGHDYPAYDGKAVVNPDGAEELLPDVPAYIEYEHSKHNRIRLSAIMRAFSYRDMLLQKKRNLLGWGLSLTGNLQPVKPLTLYWQAAYGKGIGAYLQDIAGMPLSFTPADDNPGHMNSNPMMGITVGANVKIGPKLQWNVMGSESRIWRVGDYVTDDHNYRYGLYFATNVFYSITPYLQWGLEYLYGKHATYGKGSAHDNRLQTELKFTF